MMNIETAVVAYQFMLVAFTGVFSPEVLEQQQREQRYFQRISHSDYFFAKDPEWLKRCKPHHYGKHYPKINCAECGCYFDLATIDTGECYMITNTGDAEIHGRNMFVCRECSEETPVNSRQIDYDTKVLVEEIGEDAAAMVLAVEQGQNLCYWHDPLHRPRNRETTIVEDWWRDECIALRMVEEIDPIRALIKEAQFSAMRATGYSRLYREHHGIT